MRKLINDPENFVDETLEGIVAAYGDKVRLLDGSGRVLISSYPKKPGKVGLVTGGGSGHLPVFLGYVGEGMLDGCAVGNVFASPSYQAMADAIRECDLGAGVLCLYGNYGGDRMNFEQAMEDVEFDGIRTRSVRVADDVASAEKGSAEKRRGVAGMVYAFKVAGAAADRMADLDEVSEIAEKALSNIRSMGVALSACIVPQVGKPTFSINDGELELGMGIHGEPGIEVCKMLSADEAAEAIMSKLLKDMPLQKGDEVSLMVNGLGATPLEEQLIVYRRASEIVREQGASIFMPHVGEFATSMEMAGLSITVFKLDAQLKELLAAPARTPFYTNYNK